ncbi:MAG: penicillin-binding protein [Candidatus Scalindua sp.]|nr:penicillin-binding protein 2 [Planctomycetota bacterium]GJQ57299.1 MAG: penicillin-binding protein [Candidatus Scalindua sp.]
MDKKDLPKGYRIKVNVIRYGIISIFVVLIYHLVCIQILDCEKYSSLALGQRLKKQELPTKRGMIFDRNGLVLAETIRVCSISAVPERVRDKKKTAQTLSEVLGVNQEKAFYLLNKKKDFVWIKRRVTDEQAGELKRLGLRGIVIEDEYKRVYPNGSLCCHVLGFTDIDQNGIAGVEHSLNHVLTGRKGYRLVEKDALQRQFSIINKETVFPRYGNSIYLTIDSEIQSIVEEELESVCVSNQADSATAIVMEVATGEILAMANYPWYNPNNVQKSKSKERRNRAIADSFEPGSLIKPIIVCGALDSGLVQKDEMINCYNGSYRIKRRVIRDVHPYEYLTVSDIIVNSSNIGMVQVGMLMEKEGLYNQLRSFSFGQKTGISLPGEATGKVWPLNVWSLNSVVSVSFGYEIAATPLQLTAAYSSIANGGSLQKPQIVHSISDFSGRKRRHNQSVRINRVISPRIAREVMTPILEDVVMEGTGRKAKLSGYKVAGKTGTAKKLERIDDKMVYSENKYVSSFIGFVPADDPKICVLVSVNEPKKGDYYGGVVAAPVVRNVMGRVLPYMRVKPRNTIRTVQN